MGLVIMSNCATIRLLILIFLWSFIRIHLTVYDIIKAPSYIDLIAFVVQKISIFFIEVNA